MRAPRRLRICAVCSAIAAARIRRRSSTTAMASRGTRRRRPTSWCFLRRPTRCRRSRRSLRAIVRRSFRFGVGSSLEGHVNAIHGGISVDLSRMNRILRVSVDDLDCQVEAGVTHRQLNKALANSGVYLLRRSWRRRHDRRHGRHAGIGHDGRPLRHHA